MPWVSGHWRREPGSGSKGSTGGDDFDYAAEIRITASLIEKGVPREKLSQRYQDLWDEAQRWMDNGRPENPNQVGALPPGAKWITDAMYELDGAYHLISRSGQSK
tara:strand:+ start:1783 stop:2097 length:315 start_codon:yes stop_codon:yes gene_type:complete